MKSPYDLANEYLNLDWCKENAIAPLSYDESTSTLRIAIAEESQIRPAKLILTRNLKGKVSNLIFEVKSRDQIKEFLQPAVEFNKPKHTIDYKSANDRGSGKKEDIALKAFRIWLVFWKKSFDFSGITTRKEAWTALGFNVASIFIIRFILVNIVQHAVLSLDLFVIEFFDNYFLAYANKFLLYVLVPLFWLYIAGLIIPSVSMFTRRVRDAGYNPLILLLTLIPIAGFTVPIAFMFIPSKSE